MTPKTVRLTVVIENGEMGGVENDDYAAALVRFAADSHAAGAVGTLEASRVSVGPQCGLSFEIYGTDGAWHKVTPVPDAAFGHA